MKKIIANILLATALVAGSLCVSAASYSPALQQSAEAGNASDQNNLGWIYEKGRGVKKDDAKAAYWYKKAAAQGNAWGQYNLGAMYQKGLGVKKDIAKARYWYKKAAAQGDKLAKKQLRNL